MFRRPILIARGLNFTNLIYLESKLSRLIILQLSKGQVKVIFGFQRTKALKKKSGDDGTVGTPVPIPNTEVKRSNGDDSPSGAKAASCRAFSFIGVYLGG